MNSLRDTSPTIDALSLRDPATTGMTQEMTSRLNTAWQPFVAKGPRKNNYPDFAGPKLRDSGVLPVEMDDETTEPRRSLGYVQ